MQSEHWIHFRLTFTAGWGQMMLRTDTTPSPLVLLFLFVVWRRGKPNCYRWQWVLRSTYKYRKVGWMGGREDEFITSSNLRLSGNKEGDHNQEEGWTKSERGIASPWNDRLVGLQEVATGSLTGIAIGGVLANAIALGCWQATALERLRGVSVITTNVALISQLVCGADGGSGRDVRGTGTVQFSRTLYATETMLREYGTIAALHEITNHTLHVVVTVGNGGIIQITGTSTNCHTVCGLMKKIRITSIW